ncbi:cytochrome P450 [Denitratisoma oestradiolicum]|uniref:Cytochrome P450 n=1 Tax=Denitratisoma oestradiolicum TaxID=311182 RepID=A0A6S6YRX9_9PROT|nr:cytochrome P450 [Denitratisoma oestradiolicum]TWO79674.1 cytochrome [Denitratisoma oestradiolicum]CAB1370482.1 Cytochrome P450 [Denitratisoma oestradiolicum]
MAVPILPSEIDISSPEAYLNERRLQADFSRLRNEMPIAWVDREPYRPFWSVVRNADIKAIEKNHQIFINEPRLTLQTRKAEAASAAMFGGQRYGVRTLTDMDEPDHRKYRDISSRWFVGPGLRKVLERVDRIADRFVDRMVKQGGQCDFATEVAMWYPLYVILSLFDLPEEDAPRLLQLTQHLVSASDPDLQRSDLGGTDAVPEFFEYLGRLLVERRAHPGDDLASAIATAEIDGKPIDTLEALSYYLIMVTAGHDTTSGAITGGMHALVENPAEREKLRQPTPALLRNASGEMCRWVTPVKHFMRTATEDFSFHDATIKAGDAVALFYASGNRDDACFEDPDRFRVDRKVDGHVAFGFGIHSCVGRQLALAEMDAFFGRLIPRLRHVEFAGDPKLIQSNLIGGYKSLPLHYEITH